MMLPDNQKVQVQRRRFLRWILTLLEPLNLVNGLRDMQSNKPFKVLEECNRMLKVASDNLMAVLGLRSKFQN